MTDLLLGLAPERLVTKHYISVEKFVKWKVSPGQATWCFFVVFTYFWFLCLLAYFGKEGDMEGRAESETGFSEADFVIMITALGIGSAFICGTTAIYVVFSDWKKETKSPDWSGSGVDDMMPRKREECELSSSSSQPYLVCRKLNLLFFFALAVVKTKSRLVLKTATFWSRISWLLIIAFATTGTVGLILDRSLNNDHAEKDDYFSNKGGKSIPTFMTVLLPIVGVPFICCLLGRPKEENNTYFRSLSLQFISMTMIPQIVWFMTKSGESNVAFLVEILRTVIFLFAGEKSLELLTKTLSRGSDPCSLLVRDFGVWI